MRQTAALWFLAFSAFTMGTSVPATASGCPLERSEYKSDGVTLQFGRGGEEQFRIKLQNAEFTGYITAINGYGYVAYDAWEGKVVNRGDAQIAGTVYGIAANKGTIAEAGVWLGIKAPTTILLTNVSRDIYYYLRDKKRDGQFHRFSYLFVFSKCLPVDQSQ